MGKGPILLKRIFHGTTESRSVYSHRSLIGAVYLGMLSAAPQTSGVGEFALRRSPNGFESLTTWKKSAHSFDLRLNRRERGTMTIQYQGGTGKKKLAFGSVGKS